MASCYIFNDGIFIGPMDIPYHSSSVGQSNYLPPQNAVMGRRVPGMNGKYCNPWRSSYFETYE